MKKLIIVSIKMLLLIVGILVVTNSNAQEKLPFNSLNGSWLVVGWNKDDYGKKTFWMSEWHIRGNRLYAEYKESLNRNSNNANWALRNINVGNTQATYTMSQNYLGGQRKLDVTLNNFSGAVFSGYHFQSLYFPITGARTESKGRVELRSLGAIYYNTELSSALVGNWQQQGLSTIGDKEVSFVSDLNFNIKDKYLIMSLVGEDEGIPFRTDYQIIYLASKGRTITMTAYARQTGNTKSACYYDYELTLESSGKLTGSFSGACARNGVYGQSGQIEFVRK